MRPETRLFGAGIALSLAGLGLAGCTSAPSPEPSPTPAAVSDAIELVGLWQVSDVEGGSPNTWLRLDAGDAQLLRDCGVDHYLWEARDGVFIASIGSTMGTCASDSGPVIPEWLDDAVGYEPHGSGWQLVDESGTALATLAANGSPAPNPAVSEEYTLVPPITAGTRLHFQLPASLPAFLTPGDISGRWMLEGLTDRPDVFVEFGSSNWRAKDGCNGNYGRWALVDTGLLITGIEIASQIACDNVAVAPFVFEAESAGFDGDTLVLVGAAGTELARFVRDRSGGSLRMSTIPQDYLGRWIAADFPERPEVYVEFTETAWTASDGCNRQTGAWLVGDAGFIGQGSGMTTEMWCDNVEVASWVLDADAAGFDGDTLVLVNANGAELGRLVRG